MGRVIFAEGNAGPGTESKDINLRDNDLAIIGFKGKVDQNLWYLFWYAWRLIDRDREDSEPEGMGLVVDAPTQNPNLDQEKSPTRQKKMTVENLEL